MEVIPKYNRIKRMLIFSGVLLLAVLSTGCVEENNLDQNITNQSEDETIMQNEAVMTSEQTQNNGKEITEIKIKITVEGQELTATMDNNPTTQALLEKLPLTLPMTDLFNRELAYHFPEELPAENVTNTGYEVGEIIYWPPGHSFVIMYAQNGEIFSMQKMGHIDSGVEVFEGLGNVNVTFELLDENSELNSSVKLDSTGPVQNLALSNMSVRITSKGHSATFQLYDTVAAKELYEQLPLDLNLTNFRDAQWMFYPPQKLNVTEKEAYHDGKKGELSYYAPWGDVFMLYEDFYAGDEMHRLGIVTEGIDEITEMSDGIRIEKNEISQEVEESKMRISIESNGETVVFELNDGQAAKELYEQLPLTIDVKNYSNNEKIFYPPNKLNTSNTPLANAKTGTLAYYAPWGDVVMFYGNFGTAGGLYELGNVVSGGEHIKNISGTITIKKIVN
ncbi:cyclophilin-like fold protein [Methanococcus maripaludis]|nr:cyclophilin-like fold protein [Methanococcus maripaludis]